MAIRKSLLFTVAWCAECVAISAYISLTGAGFSTTSVQPDWMMALHIATALLGALLCAQFVTGCRAALNATPSKPAHATGMDPCIGETNLLARGEKAFFPASRSMQLLGIIVCMMIQFISVQAPPVNSKQPDQTGWPVRMNASKGGLATYLPQSTNCHRRTGPSMPGETQRLLAQCDNIYTEVGR